MSNNTAFACDYAQAGLRRQGDLGRVIQSVAGAAGPARPNGVVVNRWICGRQDPPPWAIAFVRLLARLPDDDRAEILKSLDD